MAVEDYEIVLDVSEGTGPYEVELRIERTGSEGCMEIVAKYGNETWWQPMFRNQMRRFWTAGQSLVELLPACICVEPKMTEEEEEPE